MALIFELLIFTQLSYIGVVTLNGSHPNQRVLITRVDMNPSETRWPFQMQRRQFPVSISFAMTINKSQGQSLKQVGLYLYKPVFTHGQLYVALSRCTTLDNVCVFLSSDKHDESTTNVVCHRILNEES